MNWMQALALGVVQGLTEFLPISSTAHLRIVPYWLGWDDPGAEFSAVIQLGTLMAVLVYFWTDVRELILAVLIGLKNRRPLESKESRLAWSIAAGTVPVAVIGLGFKDLIKTEARALWIIGFALIILAIFLWLAEKFSSTKRNIDSLGFLRIQWIGLCQTLALIPGCSRSGSTIMGGLMMGMKRDEAARFSFLLGLPAIMASGFFELYELWEMEIHAGQYWNLILGILSSFVFGYLSIEFLLRFLRTHGTLVFVIYRITLGSIVLFFWWEME
jgi:undecaprenyl-diphosphatase